MKFRISFRRSRILIIVTIFLLLFTSLPAYAALWDNKININTQDFNKIITKLRIYDDPDLSYYNEIFRLYYSGYTGSEELLDALNKKIEITQQAMKILDADIKKDELSNLTYGRYILNAINEKELVEIGIKMGSPGQANGEYFSKLGENLADWKSQLSKFLLTKIVEATCTAMGAPTLSIGISTLGLFCDLSIIGTSINKLNEVWYEKAFWSYILFRDEPYNYGHIDAWMQLPESYINHIFILSLEKQKKAREAIEENFESLWNKYGGHIVNNVLDKNFKTKQRESLKTLLLYALEAGPHPLITSSLKITPDSPYYVGDTINAEFTITNQGKLPINFSVLTIGGRDPDNHVADFTHRQNITLEPSKSYDYQGTLTLNKVGDYNFFCTYQTPDGDWNTNVDLGPGLADEDRIENLVVKEKGEPSIVPDISKELYIEWEKTFGGSENDCARAIIQANDGGYTIAGATKSKGAGKNDAWIIKLNHQGNMLWDKTFGGSEDDYVFSLIQTNDGGYAIAGATESKGAGKNDSWIIKLSNRGNIEWDKIFGGNENDSVSSLVQTTDGNYIVAGATKSKGAGKKDAWIMKLDHEGNMLWDKTFGGSEDDYVFSLIQTTDGGYIVAGAIESEGAGKNDSWIIKLDHQGNMIWDKVYGGNEYEWMISLIQTTDGGYIVAGATESEGAGKNDAWIIKLDHQGNMIWDKVYGGGEYDYVFSLIQTNDGGYAIAGQTESEGAGKVDIWVIKLNSKSIEALEEEITTIEPIEGKIEKEKLLIDSSLYHFECSKPIPHKYFIPPQATLRISVRGPADELALMLTNPKGETDIKFISKRSLIDNFETVDLKMGEEPFSEGPYTLTVKTVTPEKVIYKREAWFTSSKNIQITDGEITIGCVYGNYRYYVLDGSITSKNEGDLPFFFDNPKIVFTTPGGQREEEELSLGSFIAVPSGEFEFDRRTFGIAGCFWYNGPSKMINAALRLHKNDKVVLTLPLKLTIEE